jgi:hypothetical protein
MTALTKYQRLESPGLWRNAPEAQRREVIVGFREATLVLSDPKTETALTHWSLPAVERLNAGEIPAVFAPGADADETLEIDDAMMIAALETVRGALARRTPRPGRLRGTLVGGLTLAILVAGVVWLPDALVRHTASVLPSATRAAIGAAALRDVERLTGAPCSTTLGIRALGMLSERLFGSAAPTIHVMRDGMTGAAGLPGRILLIGRPLIEAPDQPEAVAGYLLAEAARLDTEDPILPILRHAGLTATVRLLTSGELPTGALDGYGEAVVRAPLTRLPDEAMLARFAAVQASSAPYGYALDASGESTLGLIEADPHRTGSPRALLSAQDWANLRAICQ